MRLLTSFRETIWSKFDHLLYLPLLKLERPRDLYYYQGQGLKSLYGFIYKYLPLEQFLGQLTRLKWGQPLANALARCYTQAWYEGLETLFIFADWHVKPYWTKFLAHSGSVTMWGRVMPGTKQLVVTGPQGRLLIGWNRAIDSHFSGVLVDMEAELATIVGRPIAYTIVDSKGSGLALAERYAEADRGYLSVLSRNPGHHLTEFNLQGQWQAVVDDPDHEVVEATWVDEAKAAQEVRRLILMRPVGSTHPSRVYAGRLPTAMAVAQIPPLFRQRWYHQEWRFREMVKGANLNANYGYTYNQVSNRTRQRQWKKAEEKVEVTQGKLAQCQEALTNLRPQLAHLRQSYGQKRTELDQELKRHQQTLIQRQQAGQATVRCQRGIARRQRQRQALTARYQKRRGTLLTRLRQQRQQQCQLQAQLAEREACREAIDTDTLCRERHLEKDQIIRRTISLCSTSNCC